MPTTEFYYLQRSVDSFGWRVGLCNKSRWEDLRNFSFNLGAKPFRPSFKFKGRKASDVLICQSTLLINKKVKVIFEAEKLTGYSSFPIRISGNFDDQYSGLLIKGKASRNLTIRNAVQDVIAGFDPKSWDGSDIFSIGTTALIIVTKRVKDVLKSSHITGINVTKFNPQGTKIV